MILSPSVRRLLLTAHVTCSVGWLGAAAAYLGLVVAALNSRDAQLVRAAYLAMAPITWFAIVPLALATLLTGIVESLGTPWGLFRHYWVVFKLLLTLFATVVLLKNTRTGELLTSRATTSDGADVAGLQGQTIHAGGGALVLLVTTVLAIYKPRGLTPYGQRKRREQRTADAGSE